MVYVACAVVSRTSWLSSVNFSRTLMQHVFGDWYAVRMCNLVAGAPKGCSWSRVVMVRMDIRVAR